MLGHHAQRALEAAAADTLERIREDQRKAGLRLKPLLEHIEANLFDPALDVNQLKRSCGVRDNSVPIQFHAQLGMPPHAYIEEGRLRTGCRLLEGSDLKIWQIADLLGYSSIQVFSRAFTRWAGVRPTAYRKQALRGDASKTRNRVVHAHASRPAARVAVLSERQATEPTAVDMIIAAEAPLEAADPLPVLDERLSEVDNLRLALDGELQADLADKLIRRLLNLYPANALLMDTPVQSDLASTVAVAEAARDQSVHRAEAHSLLDRQAAERVRAELLWQDLRSKTREERFHAVASVPSKTSALFDHLCERSRVDGRDNRLFGVEVAELAIASLEGLSVPEGEKALLHAQGLAWLGNAWRLAEDYSHAAGHFREARELLPETPQEAPLAWATVLQNEAALLWARRNLDEALRLAEGAQDLYQGVGTDENIATSLLLRGDILRRLDRPAEAIDDFLRAVEVVPPSENPYIAYAAYQNVAFTYVDKGQARHAEEVLPKARRLAADLGKESLGLLVVWVEGLIARDRGDLLEATETLSEACRGFERLGEISRAGLVSLDSRDASTSSRVVSMLLF